MTQLAARSVNQFETTEKLTPEIIDALAVEAQERLEGYIEPTPLAPSEALGAKAVQVWTKDETAHPGGSFKDRGSANSVKAVSEEGISLVVASSAGNHGAGVGRAAAEEGLDSMVVVPASANEKKRERVRRTGAELVVHGQNFDESLKYGLSLTEEMDGYFVHPYADPLVMAGQGTIGLEILRQTPDATHIVLPVGGGGMLAGIGSVIKQHKKSVKIIAAQVEGNTAFVDSLKVGFPLQNQPVDSRFEGIAVGNVHPMTFELARQIVDATVVISPKQLDEAIYGYHQQHGVLLERAGAVSLAAAGKLARTTLSGTKAKLIAPASGANAPDGLDKEILRV